MFANVVSYSDSNSYSIFWFFLYPFDGSLYTDMYNRFYPMFRAYLKLYGV